MFTMFTSLYIDVLCWFSSIMHLLINEIINLKVCYYTPINISIIALCSTNSLYNGVVFVFGKKFT